MELLYAGKNIVDAMVALRDGMDVLDKSGQGIVFILDETGVMKGLLTDGDIRRALLNGSLLSDQVDTVMNRSFITGSVARPKNENARLLNEKILHLPILDEKGRLVDVLHWKDFWRLPVMEPTLRGNEAKYVEDCLATNWISSQGKYIPVFENCLRDYLKVDYALAVSNGTVALHLAMVALGIGPGDEVIVPDLTFISPASMAIHCGAIPVLADVDSRNWTLHPDAIKELITPRTRAIVPVHLYGHPCDMDPIMEIAEKHNLYVIEDCAEALGAEYKGKKVGTIGDVGTFSFFANKVITTGEGGMVTTKDEELYRKMALLRDHGMLKERKYWHVVAGFNYRLTNMQAAIGVAQMEQIEKFSTYRRKVVRMYDDCLCDIKGVILPVQESWAKNIYWLYSILIDDEFASADRDTLMFKLSERGIETRPLFSCLHVQPLFNDQINKPFPNASWLAAHGLSLPTSNYISTEDIAKVCSAIKDILT